jgi:uncharacterized cupin superfamily protein
MGVPEARLEQQEGGLVPVTDGWFVMNLAEAQGHSNGENGTYAAFESDDRRFPHFGFNVHILWPGQSPGRYHAESAQETFLVLQGECLLLVEGEERTLRQWDVFHCAPGTAHIMVGAGDGPCAILMTGARGGHSIVYPVHEPAARYGASVSEETDDPRVAYADTNRDWRPVRLPWPLDG